VRDGVMPERTLLTGMGPIPIRQPRVDDRRSKEGEEAVKWSSGSIFPRYLRLVPSVDSILPLLCLEGYGARSCSRCCSRFLGRGQGLPVTNIVRLKAHWEPVYQRLATRDLRAKK
jgi:putative transposase